MAFVIAEKKAVKAFFTSTSSYSRPKWIALDEATKYFTADAADRAVRLLWKNGSYSAQIIPLDEAMDITFGPERRASEMGQDQDFDSDYDSEIDDIESEIDEPIGEPTDSEIDDECCDDSGSPEVTTFTIIRSDAPAPNDEDDSDELDDGLPADFDDLEDDLEDEHSDETDDLESVDDDEQDEFRRPAVRESADVEQIKSDKVEEKIKLPADLRKKMTDVASSCEKEAKAYEQRDENRASFCRTVANAVKDILADIDQGTPEGFKSAQLYIAGLMSPIQHKLPSDAVTFIMRGGSKPTLGDIFASIQKRGA